MERRVSLVIRIAIVLIALYTTITGMVTARADKLIIDAGRQSNMQNINRLKTAPNLESTYMYAQWICIHGIQNTLYSNRDRLGMILKSLELFETIKKQAPGYLEIDRELNRSKKAIDNVRIKKITN